MFFFRKCSPNQTLRKLLWELLTKIIGEGRICVCVCMCMCAGNLLPDALGQRKEKKSKDKVHHKSWYINVGKVEQKGGKSCALVLTWRNCWCFLPWECFM